MEIRTDTFPESPAVFYEERYHRLFIHVARYVSKHGGTLAHAEDLYHDALIIYYDALGKPGFVLQTTEEAYIMGIVKNRWSHVVRNEQNTEDLYTVDSSADIGPTVIDRDKLYTIILSAGKKCLDMLTMFYHRRSTVHDVARAFGFASDHSASVQKYKCIEKIRETIRQNSLCHEDFFE